MRLRDSLVVKALTVERSSEPQHAHKARGLQPVLGQQREGIPKASSRLAKLARTCFNKLNGE